MASGPLWQPPLKFSGSRVFGGWRGGPYSGVVATQGQAVSPGMPQPRGGDGPSPLSGFVQGLVPRGGDEPNIVPPEGKYAAVPVYVKISAGQAEQRG